MMIKDRGDQGPGSPTQTAPPSGKAGPAVGREGGGLNRRRGWGRFGQSTKGGI